MRSIKLFAFLLFLGWLLATTGLAEVTSDQRKELSALVKQTKQAAVHLRKKEFDRAEKVLDEVEGKIEKIATDAGVTTADPVFKPALNALRRQRELLNRARGNRGDTEKVSFLEEIAPIVMERCLTCHGSENPRAQLRLDTFVGWRRGGRSGALLVPGQALNSLLMSRLTTTNEEERMPRRGDPLSREELEAFSDWINQGARFDDEREDVPLADLVRNHEQKTLNITIPKPKGNETIKFTRDIAPWFVALCSGCHNSQRRSGGLSIETFHDLMKGGDSGPVIIPGDMENSRLFRLVGGLELPRMPQGMARITRKNYEDLKQWFLEGNTFDGDDPLAPMRNIVLNEADPQATRFTAMDDEQMRSHRKARSLDQLKRTVPNDPPVVLEQESFLLLGNIAEVRLNEIAKWAKSDLETLQKFFGAEGSPWRGGLALFVMKDEFSYGEFNQVIEQRRPQRDVVGHFKVSTNQEDAYVVLLDSGNDLSTHSTLMEQLTGAFLEKEGIRLPVWMVRGTGLMMAESVSSESDRWRRSTSEAASLVKTLRSPQELFSDEAFSPEGTAIVGYTLVKHLVQEGGKDKFAKLVQSLQNGNDLSSATASIYSLSLAELAQSYLTRMKSR